MSSTGRRRVGVVLMAGGVAAAIAWGPEWLLVALAGRLVYEENW